MRRKTVIPCETIYDWAAFRELHSRELHSIELDTKTLLLVDALVDSLDEFFRSIEDSRERTDRGFIPALFNLERGGGVEPRALKYGVKGFFYLDEDLKTLLRGIHALFAGETWIPRATLLDIAVHGTSLDGDGFVGHFGLTHRETEILAHLSVGTTNEEIADRMCISTHTVKAHLYNIYKKIQVDNRFQAALWATKYL